MLSRNTPVALVVGAAGFIGSHLTDKLLEKNVQILGVDDLFTGKLSYIENASKNKNFHLLHQSIAENLEIDIPRMDYAFFLISENINRNDYRTGLSNFMRICAKFNTKIVYVSSIELYDKKTEGLDNIREAEAFLARHSTDNKSNIRIVRLGEIYGPRMHFRGQDPIVRLLKSAGLTNIVQDDSPLDFTTRAIFVDDAINLLIKALMHGATAQKIYDGVLLNPIKVMEIKQILLDPLWHENRNFIPTELPPWPTPNILKTENELSWKPNTNIVSALKQTVHFLKENSEFIKADQEPEVIEKKEVREKIIVDPVIDKEQPTEKINHSRIKEFKKKGSRKIKKYLILVLGITLIIYALFYPMLFFTWQILATKNYLQSSLNQVAVGNITQAEVEVERAENSAQIFQEWVKNLHAIGNAGIFESQLRFGEDSLDMIYQGTKAVSFWVKGVKDLGLSMQILSGVKEGNLGEVYLQVNSNFNQAENILSFISTQLSDSGFQHNIPAPFRDKIRDYQNRVEYYQKLVEQSKKIARLLPAIFDNSLPRSYLLVLVDNNNLRAGGGKPITVAKLSFDQGKLKEIKVESVEVLDQQLKENIEIPLDLKADLPVGNWKMGDTNFDVDSPINSKLFQWFYQKESGIQTDGVLTLDLNGLNEILLAIGPIILPSKKQISSENFLALTIDADNLFYRDVLKEVLNKIFFLSNQNYLMLAGSLGKSFAEKHSLLYMSDPLLFSQLNSLNFTGVMSRQIPNKIGEKDEFLAILETNLGAKTSFDLKKNINLQSTIDGKEELTHKLQITYLNQSDTKKAIFREKIYLSAGTKLNKATFAGISILKNVSSYVDFGRTVYSFILEVGEKEEKTLVLEYQDNKKLEFNAGVTTVNLEVMKQLGERDNNFIYKLIYPQNFMLVSPNQDQSIPQEVSFSTILTTDKHFQVKLKK